MSLFSEKKPENKTIELSDKHRTLRLVLVCALVVIGAAAFAFALTSSLDVEPGWQVVTADTQELHCGDEFVFSYSFADTGSSAKALFQQVQKIYTDAAVKAYRLFDTAEIRQDSPNIAYINAHPNQEITVDPVLYDAFALLQGTRHLYLAGVYEQYNSLFFSENDVEAGEKDPGKSGEAAEYVANIAAFANDPQHIDLELLGNGKIKLFVSEEFLHFSEENELIFIDFHWMKNAFIADFLSDAVTGAGFDKGYIASYDGFTRNFFRGEENFDQNFFDLEPDGAYHVGKLTYRGPMSMVYLRSYPMSQLDQWHYYSYGDGSAVSCYVDPADGQSRPATDNLVVYTGEKGCGELLAALLPVYVADTLDTGALKASAQEGVYSLWFEEQTLCYTQQDIVLSDLYADEVRTYTAKHVTE